MTEVMDAKPKRKPSVPIRIGIITAIVLLIVLGTAIALWPRPNFGYQGELEDLEGILDKYPTAVPFEVDFPAPDLTLADLEGNPVSLSNYRGQVVLVNIWAFWCPPCRAEMPVLQDYYEEYRHQNFVVIGIEAGDEAEDVAYHLKLFKLTFPNWQDPNGYAPRAFKIGFLPSSYVIDRDGQVRLAWSGAISREMLEKFVTPLLEE